MKRKLQLTEHSQIVALLEQRLSSRDVARKFNVSQSTVVRTKINTIRPNLLIILE